MKVEVKVKLRDSATLPETAVCRLEVRDVSLLDAPSVTVCAHKESVSAKTGETIVTATLDVPESDDARRDLNVWAHLSMTGEKGTRPDDYITTQSYPIRSGGSKERVSVDLQPVRPRRK